MTSGIIHIAVDAVEIRGPGLTNWAAARPVLAGREPYRAAPIVLDPPAELSPAERRRAIPSVKLALAVGIGAVEESGHDPAQLPAVFASSGADGDTISAILSSLATVEREVSPTRFHNSVHNAPSGYWGIATQSCEAVTSISGYDASFAMGLLEASAQALSGSRPVLLIAYDLPYPGPLREARQVGDSFGAAFVLNPRRSPQTIAELTLTMRPPAKTGTCDGISRDTETTACADAALEVLRAGNPAARSLPLLAMLAARVTGQVRIDLPHGMLEIGVAPC